MIYITFEKCENTPKAQSAAGIIARNKLLDNFGLNSELCLKAESGKPYYAGENIFFSVSHCEDIAVCALRTYEESYDAPDNILAIFDADIGELGIDIEKEKSDNELTRLNNIAKRFFKTEFNTVSEFLTEWTKAEAFAKKEDIPLASAIALKEKGSTLTLKAVIDSSSYFVSIAL